MPEFNVTQSAQKPTSEDIDHLVTLFNQGRFIEGEAFARRHTTRFPQHGFGWMALGVMLKLQGRTVESLEPMQQAATLLPLDAEAHFNLGNTLNDLGRMKEAKASYCRALEIKPDYAEAHSNLGNTLKDQGRLEGAEACYRRALKIKPDFAEAYYNLSITLKDLGRLDEAKTSCRRVLEIKPNSAKAHSNLGSILNDLGQMEEAEACYRRALEIEPNFAEAHYNLGNTLNDQGRLEEAEACCRRALEIKPDFAEAHYILGNALNNQGRMYEAEVSYRRALKIKPEFPDAHYNLGKTLKDLGRLKEAEACYRQALVIKPDFTEAHCNLGNSLKDLGRLKEAEACYRRALKIKPDFAEAYSNLGSALNNQGRLEEAEACYRRALEIKPDFAEAYSNLGNSLKDVGRLEEAEVCYRRALEIEPNYPEAHSNLLFSLNYTDNHHLSYYFDEACRYGQMVARKVRSRFSAWQCIPQPERLRVGLVSGDLYNHPVGYFLENILARIDPSRIELIAYPTDYKMDALTVRIRPYFSLWKSLVGLSDEVAARLIHADGVHLLLDLSGHSAKNRLQTFAWKPAPIQASWLGYFATTGVTEMDYLLGDPYITPETEAGHFTETVWKLPESYLCFTPPEIPLEVGPLPALSSNCITFGSFNNLTKMNDAVVTLWAKVLLAVPHSRLFLKTNQLNDHGVRDTTRQRFAACGITPDRLLLEGGSPRANLLETYNRIDIALDPFPYPGGTTSAEGLWMGVPVITRRGDRFLSHLGESIAYNAGLFDWIADHDDDYVAKAVMHTGDLAHLARLRTKLRQQVLASPLFDAPRFARHFEAALWGMWERWQNR